MGKFIQTNKHILNDIFNSFGLEKTRKTNVVRTKIYLLTQADWKYQFFCRNISLIKSSMGIIPPSLHPLDNTGKIPQRISPNQALLRPLIDRFPQELVLRRPPSWIEGATLSRLHFDQRLTTRQETFRKRTSNGPGTLTVFTFNFPSA